MSSIRPRTPADDAAIVHINHATAPEFPEETVEEFRHWIETSPPDAPVERVVGEQDGVVVAAGDTGRMFWTDKPDRFRLGVNVAPDRWGQGIGSKLYDYLVARARHLGATRVYGHYLASVPRAQKFAEDRGFSPTGRVHRLSRLDVRNANMDGYDGIGDRLQSTGIHVTTLADQGVDNEPFLQAVYELDGDASRDVPSSEPIVPTSYEVWKKQLLGAPGWSPEMLWVAMDGKHPAGLAVVRRTGADIAWNNFTGVRREYRGRGVARALKQCTVDWSRRNGVNWIYTGNDVSNARMLAINIRLGYEMLPESIEVVKQLA